MLLKINRKNKSANDEPNNFLLLAKDQIGVSDEAKAHIEMLISKHDEASFLRISIKGGGCSGLSIHYELTNTAKDYDVHFDKVIIDKKSLSVIGGATLHCREYLGAKEFYLVNNPAQKQCSCGQSFSL